MHGSKNIILKYRSSQEDRRGRKHTRPPIKMRQFSLQRVLCTCLSLLSQLLDISTRGKALYYTQSPPIPESGASVGGRKSKLIHPKPPFFFFPPFSHLPCFFYLLLYALSPLLLFWTQRGGKGDGETEEEEKSSSICIFSLLGRLFVFLLLLLRLLRPSKGFTEKALSKLSSIRKNRPFLRSSSHLLSPLFMMDGVSRFSFHFFPRKFFYSRVVTVYVGNFVSPHLQIPRKKATKHSCCSRLYYDAATKQREKYRFSLGPAPSPLWPTRWDPLVAHTRLAHKEGP